MRLSVESRGIKGEGKRVAGIQRRNEAGKLIKSTNSPGSVGRTGRYVCEGGRRARKVRIDEHYSAGGGSGGERAKKRGERGRWKLPSSN